MEEQVSCGCSCAVVYHTCTVLYHICAIVHHSCAIVHHSCTLVYHSCALVYHSCAIVYHNCAVLYHSCAVASLSFPPSNSVAMQVWSPSSRCGVSCLVSLPSGTATSSSWRTALTRWRLTGPRK